LSSFYQKNLVMSPAPSLKWMVAGQHGKL
jgi:hypothetical protein